jgi:membrane-associated phospholipid phosphatase
MDIEKSNPPHGGAAVFNRWFIFLNSNEKQPSILSLGYMNQRVICSKWLLDFILLTGLAAIVMIAATVFDQRATLFLVKHKSALLSKLMGRTLFEGELPGINDILAFLLITASIIYIIGWCKKDNNRWSLYRPQTGFVLICALVMAFILMHGFKLSFGRARPSLVFDQQMPFSAWFVFGPHFIGNGLYSGAFPSGHTAQAFSAMSFAYILTCDPIFKRSWRWLGVILGGGVILFCMIMGVARCMSSSHWLTDVVGSVCLGWPIMHLLYYWLLLIPEQCRYQKIHGDLPDLPLAWELRMGGYLLLTALGIIIFINGWRAVILGQSYWITAFMPFAGWLIHHTLCHVIRLRYKVKESLSLH